ncbi:MAG: hypothetical protein WA817_17910 [Candidatus Acidiferrum sp.]
MNRYWIKRLPSPGPFVVLQPGSDASSSSVVYETIRTQSGSFWRARPWKSKESNGDNQRPRKRAQKERKRIGRRATGPLEKGACEAQAFEVSKRKGDEETDFIMESRLVELR